MLYAGVDVDEKLHKPAARSVLAHVVKLVSARTVPSPTAPPRLASRYERS